MPDYGTGVYCQGDLRPDMPKVTGRALLAQDLRNRFESAAGSLEWDPQGADYGYDLRALVNVKVRDLARYTQRIVIEAEKDDRVDSAQCTAEWVGDGRIEINLTIDDGDGPFPLTLSVSALTVEILTNGL